MMEPLVGAGATRILPVAFVLALLVPMPLIGLQIANATEPARDARSLHAALEQLTTDGKFSGAVVVHGAGGVHFAEGYGLADPFSERRFTPETPVDSASLAKPVTAAAVLLLAKEGKIDLDKPVRHYLSGYPHEATMVRHLLAHSAGLPPEANLEPLANKTNEMLMNEVADRHLPPMFTPGTAFNYCNFCYTTLALLIERVSGTSYLSLVQKRAALPTGVTIRPLRLADWPDRAIGYRRTPAGKIERADSYESEAFYGGSRNLPQYGLTPSCRRASKARYPDLPGEIGTAHRKESSATTSATTKAFITCSIGTRTAASPWQWSATTRWPRVANSACNVRS
jgi:CubicO group peptidase (beta-lactamase class C family)